MGSPRCTSGPLTLPAGILVGRSDLAVVHHRMQRAQSDDVVNVAAGAAAHVGVEDELHRRRGARHGGPTEPGGQHSRAELQGVGARVQRVMVLGSGFLRGRVWYCALVGVCIIPPHYAQKLPRTLDPIPPLPCRGWPYHFWGPRGHFFDDEPRM